MAAEEINEFGREIKVRHVPKSSADPNNPGGDRSEDPLDMIVKAVIDPIDNKKADGELIKVTDLSCLIASHQWVNNTAVPNDRDIKVSDKVFDNDISHEIITLSEVKPGDDLIMYEIVIRKGAQ